jgi:hypothetical protein
LARGFARLDPAARKKTRSAGIILKRRFDTKKPGYRTTFSFPIPQTDQDFEVFARWLIEVLPPQVAAYKGTTAEQLISQITATCPLVRFPVWWTKLSLVSLQPRRPLF